MIRQVRLGGISRTPSDRTSGDGGCAESLNMYVDRDEIAPMIPPEDITETEGLAGMPGPAVYIHDGRYIVNVGSKLVYGPPANNTWPDVYTFRDSEVLVDVRSIGNTLLILTDKRMEYVLWKDGAYKDLGDEIPSPDIGIVQEDVAGPDVSGYEYEVDTDEMVAHFGYLRKLCGYPNAGETTIRRDDMVSWPEEETAYLKAQLEKVRSVNERRFLNRLEEQYLLRPVFIRYAARLYDGSYTKHSAPILIDPHRFTESGLTDMLSFRFMQSQLDGKVYFDFGFFDPDDHRRKSPAGFRITFEVKNAANYDNWKDIVTGVDIFASETIDRIHTDVRTVHGYLKDSDLHSLDYNSNYWDIGDFLGSDAYLQPNKSFVHLYFGPTPKELLKEVSSHSVFYRIKEIPTEDYIAAQEPIAIEDYRIFRNDTLVVQPTLPDDRGSHKAVLPSSIRTYNNRLIASGISVRYMSGYPELPSSKDEATDYDWILRYHIRASDSDKSDAADPNSDIVIVSRLYADRPGPWLFYPDPGCYSVDVIRKDGDNHYISSHTMYEDTYLNGACCFLGWGGGMNPVTPYIYRDTDSLLREKRNTLMYSAAFNPFTFASEQMFPGNVTDIALITKALSEGQFGYSDLYVFTDAGIWTMTTAADGSFSSTKPVTTDVALPGTVCQLDQAIVYTTKRAVMLMTGSEVSSISGKMNGKHYALEPEAAGRLEGTDWEGYVSLMQDGTSFMDFMKDAVTVYDYTNKRLVFMSGSKQYAYVFMLEAGTWHKMPLPDGMSFEGTVNSYPDAYVSMSLTEDNAVSHRLVNLSAAPDATDERKYRCIAVTRPLSLGEYDVRKTLLSMRVRGVFGEGSVSYILLGSMDGQTFSVLDSLRGGSFRWFRIALLCELSPAERVSWIDADFGLRLNNRLR